MRNSKGARTLRIASANQPNCDPLSALAQGFEVVAASHLVNSWSATGHGRLQSAHLAHLRGEDAGRAYEQTEIAPQIVGNVVYATVMLCF